MFIYASIYQANPYCFEHLYHFFVLLCVSFQILISGKNWVQSPEFLCFLSKKCEYFRIYMITECLDEINFMLLLWFFILVFNCLLV